MTSTAVRRHTFVGDSEGTRANAETVCYRLVMPFAKSRDLSRENDSGARRVLPLSTFSRLMYVDKPEARWHGGKSCVSSPLCPDALVLSATLGLESCSTS